VFDFDFVARTVQRYVAWLKVATFVVLFGFGEDGEPVFRYFRSPKRGDFRYAWRVKRRFDGVEDRVPKSKPFFKFGEHGIVRSRCLLVTSTYGRSVGLTTAWRSIGVDFNRYLSYLRKKYGKLSVVRCWESHLDGYPHVHALIYFQSWSFKGFSHVNLKGKLTYRVYSRRAVQKGWRHGHVDVLAMSSVHSGFHYVSKYLCKSVQVSGESKVVKTLALCWQFRKRAFSLSGDWQLAPSDLIVDGANSNSVSVVPGFSGVSSDVSTEISWKMFGLMLHGHALLGDDGGDLEVSAVDELLNDGLLQW